VFDPEFTNDDVVNGTTDVLPRVNFTVPTHYYILLPTFTPPSILGILRLLLLPLLIKLF